MTEAQRALLERATKGGLILGYEGRGGRWYWFWEKGERPVDGRTFNPLLDKGYFDRQGDGRDATSHQITEKGREALR